MEALSTTTFLFGDFELDGSKRLLLKQGNPVALNSKTLDLLLVLVENHGSVLSRDELLDKVWANQFVEENNLAVQISALRKIFGERKDEHRFIVTVPGRGYSFVAELDEPADGEIIIESHSLSRIVVEEESAENDLRPADDPDVRPRLPAAPSWRSRVLLVGLPVLILAVSGLGYWFFLGRTSGPPQVESIAVMPFVNDSGNPDLEYLSDGMTESLINSLSRLKQLSVKARTTVSRYKNRDVQPQQIGSDLNVQAVLNGRVVQRADQLTLYLSLIDTRTGNQIWGEQYDRKQADLVSLQSEIARDVSNKLLARLSVLDKGNLTKSYTTDPEAYRAYLKGRYFINKHTEGGYKKGLEHFQRAIAIDPNYALAYVGIADAYISASDWYLSVNDSLPEAKAAALKALEMDDSLAEAHATMMYVNLFYDWNWAGVEREYRRTVELDPNNVSSHYGFVLYLIIMGRSSESIEHAKQTFQIDPLSIEANRMLGDAFLMARDYHQAIEQYHRTIEMDPYYWWPHLQLAESYLEVGRFAEAIAEMEKARSLDTSPLILRELGRAYAVAGNENKAREILEELKTLSGKSYVSPEFVALIHGALGERDAAFEWLEKAFADRSIALLFLKTDPDWDDFRSDPRFQDLMRRVGL